MGDRFMRNIRANQVDKALKNVFDLYGTGAPLSGSSARADFKPTGLGICGFGSVYTDIASGVRYVNEGTKSALYWTPVSFSQQGLLGVFTDWRNGVGHAHASTVASVITPEGVRIFGAGADETDAGVVVTQGANGAVARVTSSATTNLPVALSMGGSTVIFDPATNGPLVVDAIFTIITDLLTKRVFIGFIGTAADALVSPATGSTVTITLVQDNLSGMMFDAALTAATRWFAAHNKADEAASHLVSATGVDTGVNVAAVTVYQRLRVEISATGVMTCFINKAQVTQIAASASPTVDLAPVLLISGSSSAIDVMDVKQFAAWGNRVAA